MDKEANRLFVASLHGTINEDTLKTFFETWGEVVNCTVVRDHITGASCRYGFVSYRHSEMVDDCLAAQPHIINEIQLVICQATSREEVERLKSLRHVRYGRNMLFVRGLHGNINGYTLKTFFGTWGDVEYCTVVRDHITGASRRYGFVSYYHSKMVDDCLAAQPHIIDGKELYICRATPREEAEKLKSLKHVRYDSNMLFVGSLHGNINGYTLKRFFETWGEVVNCSVVRNHITGESCRCGFVEYRHSRMVDDCLAEQPLLIDGKELYIRRARSREESEELKREQLRNDRAESKKPDGLRFERNAREESKKPDGLRLERNMPRSVPVVKTNPKDILCRDLYSNYHTQSVDIIVDKKSEKKQKFAFIYFDITEPLENSTPIHSDVFSENQGAVKMATERGDQKFQDGGVGLVNGGSRRKCLTNEISYGDHNFLYKDPLD